VGSLPVVHRRISAVVEVVDDGMDDPATGDMGVEAVEEGREDLGRSPERDQTRTSPVCTARPAVRHRVPCRM
jgi:hypothetical protein